jgi:hypothetical protein
MPKPRYCWSAEVEARIVTAIRNGAYPIVAAEVNGIPREVFAEWIRRSRLKHASPRWRTLGDRIREAVAYARLKAEAESLRQDSRTWLKHGPGREMPDAPGWTLAIKPYGRGGAEESPAGMFTPGDLVYLIPELEEIPPALRAGMVSLITRAREAERRKSP